MKQDINIAIKCFEENIPHPTGQPEKYNLYNGLANLAGAIRAMAQEIEELREEVRRLQRR